MENKIFKVRDYWATAVVASCIGKRVDRGDTFVISTDTVLKPTKLIKEWDETVFYRRIKACGYTHVEYTMQGSMETGWMGWWAKYLEDLRDGVPRNPQQEYIDAMIELGMEVKVINVPQDPTNETR